MMYSCKFDLIKSIAKVEELALKRNAGHTRQQPEMIAQSEPASKILEQDSYGFL